MQKVVEENRVAARYATYVAAGEKAAEEAGITADDGLDAEAIDLAKAKARATAIADATKADFNDA